ncbi:MAG: permease-like cell division protein FtsX [Gammaproteobacteria bacterium]|nr:permease-like cell division protein FtsX [Gammaproteobacteria bacterium]
MRHLQAILFSLGQLWRQPLATLMTIIVIGIALVLPAGLYVLLQNMNNISDQWDDASQITLFLEKDLSETQAENLSSKLQNWPEIKQTDYQNADRSLIEFRQLSGLGNLLDSLPDNPLPAIIIVYPADENLRPDAIGSLLARLEDLPEVEQAQLDMEWLQRLRSINKTIQRGISILAILLSLSVLLVIGNTIRLAILNRQSEIQVMKLVGATNRFIRRPFLYTGFWYGTLGGVFAWLTLVLTMGLLTGPIRELAGHYGSDFSLEWFAGYMFVTLPMIGASLGASGAWLAVSRHLHTIEPD